MNANFVSVAHYADRMCSIASVDLGSNFRRSRGQNSACFIALAATLLAVIVPSGANASSMVLIERICDAAPVSPGSIKQVAAPIIVNRQKVDGPLLRLQARTDEKGIFSGARSVPVSIDEAKRLCAAGYPVDVLDTTGVARKSGDSQKTYVQPMVSLPSSFSIVGLWGITWGNFWVPNAMPNGHTYQVVDFTVEPYNYPNSGQFSHLAVSTLTVSNSDLDHDFDGKGAIFYAALPGCGSVLQSWAITGYSDGPPQGCSNPAVCSNPVFNGAAPSPWAGQPNTCDFWDASTPRRFLVGANIWQQSVYWTCTPSGGCPGIASPTVDSTTSYFRSGGAGVAFINALSYSSSVWSLTFSNVNSYTGW